MTERVARVESPRVLHAVRWTPPTPPPPRDISDPALPPIRRIETPGSGPEDVILDRNRRLVTGLADGRILRIDPGDGSIEIIGDTGGRPLGLEPCPDGSVLICDSRRGLLRLDPASGAIEVLVDSIGGVRLLGTSNAVRDDDGTIYFTSSTRRFDVDDNVGDILEHNGGGRLFRRDADGTVETLLEGLDFANGLVLAPDSSCLLVAQTAGYCITRYWLTGPRTGQAEPLVENMPGFPDNMSVGDDGLVWVAIATPRNPVVDTMASRAAVFRQLIWLLPHRLRPKAERTVFVQAYTFDGELVHDLQRPGDNFFFATGVVADGGTLYLSSFYDSAIGVTQIP